MAGWIRRWMGLMMLVMAGKLWAFDSVVSFNEISYNPPGAGETGEWIELANLNGVNVDVSGWRISGGVNFTFPAGTVIPGKGYLVVAADPAASGVAGALGPWRGSLSNAGEEVVLRDNNDRIMDAVSYQDKGEWPVAPDGSGATLVKRRGEGASREAVSWTFSQESGGTPGAVNFPLPPGPVTVSAAAFDSDWRYRQGGQEAGNGWTAVGFDDAGWTVGKSGFVHGDARLYMESPPVISGGYWAAQRWTSNADSGIASANVYTHRICLNRATAVAAINGVTFVSPGLAATSGSNWRLLGATVGFNNNGNGAGANSLPAGTGSRQLCEDFFYGAGHTGGVSRLELSGLTAGKHYITTLYSTGFGGLEARRMQITPSDTRTPVIIDQNAANSGLGMTARYHFKCPESGGIAFDFLPLSAGATWHHYAFSNHEAPAFPDEIPVSGNASIADFSSELTTGFSRAAVNVVNGNGLAAVGGVHGTTAEGTMWLSAGTLNGGTDPLPAQITFDLGTAGEISSMRVWNYNEAGQTTRGANLVEILAASEPGGPFTTVATVNFGRAFGVTSEIGQRVPLNLARARYVRLNILTTHGGDNQLAGLSEVRFFRSGTPGAPVPVALRVPVTSLWNSGVGDDGRPLPPGAPDPHYVNLADNQPAVAMSPNAAWLQDDGVSRFIGFSGSGNDNAPAGTFSYRMKFRLDGYVAGTERIDLFAAADNSLDSVRIDGGEPLPGAVSGGFAAFAGPFRLPGPLAPGEHTVDFAWSNAGPGANPGGLRIRWGATAEPAWGRTVLPANPLISRFRRNFTLPGGEGTSFTAVLRHAVDDGAIFYLNGQEVHRFNLPAGPLGADTAAVSDIRYPMISARIPLDGSMLRPGANVLAVELRGASAGAVDAWFMASLEVTGVSPPATTAGLRLDKLSGASGAPFVVDLINPTGAGFDLSSVLLRGSEGQEVRLSGSLAAGARLSLSESVLGFRPLDGDKLFLLGAGGQRIFDGQVVKQRAQARLADGTWATPSVFNAGGAALFAIPDQVVINEIMYHHQPVTQATGIVEDPEEWVELHNRGNVPVPLAGWKVRGGISFDFGAADVLPAGGYLVLARDPAALLARFPGIAVTGPFSGTLSNRGDTIVLEDPSDNVADRVSYRTGGRWDGRADGGGTSLELRDPDADNAVAESWAASDEAARSQWQTFSFTGTGAPFAGTNDPTQFHELILGLLNGGECLIDDISVKEVSAGNRELIQNGNFTGGTNAWRLIGNHGSHGRTVVVDDPSNPGNPVLRMVATGSTEHMHNQCSTTLKSGSSYVSLSNAATYQVSFRARWLSGSPRLLSRLYFNRLARQAILPVPVATGTPGTINSRRIANLGPSLTGLQHAPVVPLADQVASVRVRAADPDGVSSVVLRWRLDGASAFASLPMNGGPEYSASLPAQAAGSLVEFFVEATDAAGAVSRYPANGALVRWNDGTVPQGPGHGLRVLMTAANADFMHLPTNVMSNDMIPCTVVYQESEVFYNAGCRLKSSQRGRLADIRLGFAIEFDPEQPFRGVMTTVNLDRSGYGRGTPGSGYGHSEIINWHFFSRAGGLPSMYNDMVYLISPRAAHTGSAVLTMAEFNDAYLDGQWNNGADTPTFKYELIYWPTTTQGGVEGLKLPQPDNVNAVTTSQISSPDKEAYRWNFLIGNARNRDDYSRIVNLSSTFRLSGTAYTAALPGAIDVDQWLRCFAAYALAGPGDHYTTSTGGWHNLKLYHRNDGRILFLPWDGDFLTQASNAALVIAPDLSKMIASSPANHRAYYGHLNDIMNRSFRADYLGTWADHYSRYSTTGGNWGEITTYVAERVAFVRTQLNTLYPALSFAVSTNGGADFSTPDPQVVLGGSAGLDVRAIRINGGEETVPVTWPTRNTWSITLPVVAGANPFLIEAIGFGGDVVGSDTITVTGTGAVEPAGPGNLVISELQYHPADLVATEAPFTDAEDFEFIELQNIGKAVVSLNGVRFTAGITWTAPATATIPPGGRVVIPRRTAAFTLRYPGVATLPEYYQAGGNVLSNAGEEIALVDGSGADIRRFRYSDSAPWPNVADGGGPSLVLIAPGLNPDHADPLNWRSSLAAGGQPGGSDAIPPPGDPSGDSDGDGLSNLLEYATGGSRPEFQVAADGSSLAVDFVRARGVEAVPGVQLSGNLQSWQAQAAELLDRSFLADGSERIRLRVAVPAGSPSHFARLIFRVP